MTVVADLLLAWGSLNALVLLIFAGVARWRADRGASVLSNHLAAARDPASRAQRHGAR